VPIGRTATARQTTFVGREGILDSHLETRAKPPAAPQGPDCNPGGYRCRMALDLGPHQDRESVENRITKPI
jgi:hypothetical protein